MGADMLDVAPMAKKLVSIDSLTTRPKLAKFEKRKQYHFADDKLKDSFSDIFNVFINIFILYLEQ